MKKERTIKHEKTRLFLTISTLALGALTAFVLVACGDSVTKGGRTYFVAGVIVDSLTKSPLDSVRVWWHDTLGAPPEQALAYSNSQGQYRIGVPEGGRRKISAAKSGYTTKTIPTGVSWSPDTVRIDFEIARVE